MSLNVDGVMAGRLNAHLNELEESEHTCLCGRYKNIDADLCVVCQDDEEEKKQMEEEDE